MVQDQTKREETHRSVCIHIDIFFAHMSFIFPRAQVGSLKDGLRLAKEDLEKARQMREKLNSAKQSAQDEADKLSRYFLCLYMYAYMLDIYI